VLRVGDANDLDFLERALKTFKNTTDRPTLIIVDSHIAYGAPNKQDTHAAHGEPLGEQGISLTHSLTHLLTLSLSLSLSLFTSQNFLNFFIL
jgi:transketolase